MYLTSAHFADNSTGGGTAMVKSIAHGNAEQAVGMDHDVLKAVTLEVFCELLDNKANNDAFQVLLSRNEMSAQPAAIEILSSTVDIEVKVESTAIEITRLSPCEKSSAVPYAQRLATLA